MCTYYFNEDFLDDKDLYYKEGKCVYDLNMLEENNRREYMLNIYFPNLSIEEKLIGNKFLLVDIYINVDYLFISNVLKDVTSEDIHKFVKYVREFEPAFKRVGLGCRLDNYYSLDTIVNSKSDNKIINEIKDRLFYCFMEIRDNI